MEGKKWYESKLFWVGILITLQGVIPLVNDMLKAAPVDASAILALLSGIIVVVLRVWFTDIPVR